MPDTLFAESTAKLVQCQSCGPNNKVCAPSCATACDPSHCTKASKCDDLYRCPHALVILSRLPAPQYAALLDRSAAAVDEYVFCPTQKEVVIRTPALFGYPTVYPINVN